MILSELPTIGQATNSGKKICQRLIILFIIIYFSAVFTNPCRAEESILSNSPQQRAKLLECEKKAPSDIKRAIKKLRDKDPAQKANAARELGGSRAKGAILALLEMLDDNTSLIWVWEDHSGPGPSKYGGPANRPSKFAAEALVRIGEPAVEPLIAALKNKEESVREKVVYALGAIKDPRAVEPLITALKDDQEYVRMKAAEALGAIKDPRAVEPLIAALKDKGPSVRVKAAKALGRIKDPRAVEPLIAALKEVQIGPEEKTDPMFIRDDFVSVLGRMEDPRAVEPLIAALKDKRWGVRRNAADALGAIKDPRAVEPLNAALKDDNEYVRKSAVSALVNIKDPRAVEPLIAALKDDNGDVRVKAAKALGMIKDPRAVEPLIAALKDKQWYVRHSVALALFEITGRKYDYE